MAVDQSEILKEAIETLRADAALTALLGGSPNVFNHVPQDKPPAYVVVAWSGDVDYDTKDSLGFDGTMSHAIVSTHHGDRDILRIQDRLRAIYLESPLVLTSGEIVCFFYQSGSVEPQVLETHRGTASFNAKVDDDI